ncbi:MAG: hypothetical protein WC520_00165 [Candidatus Paceibacterota bacterium]
MKKAYVLIVLLCLFCLFSAATAVKIDSKVENQVSSHGNHVIDAANLANQVKEKINEQLIRAAARIRVIKPIDSPNRPDYYLVGKINPQKYIDKTFSEKGTNWFAFSENEKKWRIDWDAERKPLKYIGIHTVENMPLSEMNAKYKASLYDARYRSNDTDPYVKGLTPHSGHLMWFGESFIPFHWLIYSDGHFVLGVNPALIWTPGGFAAYAISWALGNWGNNCEAFSMAFVYEAGQTEPTEKQIRTANIIIDEVRRLVPDVIVAPHYQFNSQTNCPGFEFEQWSQKLH